MAAPAFRSNGTAAEATSTNTRTVSYTVTAGDSLFVLVEVLGSDPTISSVSSDVDGGLTQIGSTVPGGTSRSAALYWKQNATAGAHTVTITTSASVTLLGGMAFGYSNVGSIGTPTSGSGTNSTPSLGVTVTSGNTMLMVLVSDETMTAKGPGATGTEQVETTTANCIFYVWDSTTAGTPHTITSDASFVNQVAEIAVELQAAGGGGTAVPAGGRLTLLGVGQ